MSTRLRLSVAVGCALAMILGPVGCAQQPAAPPAAEAPGSPPAFDAPALAATAAAEALRAYRFSIEAGSTRTEALNSARDAALAETRRLFPDLADARYRPYIELALLALDTAAARPPAPPGQKSAAGSGESRPPGDADVMLAVHDAIAEADAAAAIKVDFHRVR